MNKPQEIRQNIFDSTTARQSQVLYNYERHHKAFKAKSNVLCEKCARVADELGDVALAKEFRSDVTLGAMLFPYDFGLTGVIHTGKSKVSFRGGMLYNYVIRTCKNRRYTPVKRLQLVDAYLKKNYQKELLLGELK